VCAKGMFKSDLTPALATGVVQINPDVDFWRVKKDVKDGDDVRLSRFVNAH